MATRLSTRCPLINITPVLLREKEDFASLSAKYKGKNGEGLFARATVIFAVLALEHFIDSHLDRIASVDDRKKVLAEIRKQASNRKIGTTVAAKWYVVTDHYIPSRFQINVPPFSDLKKLARLRNRVVHLSQKQVQSRDRTGTPIFLRQVNSTTAASACNTAKATVSAFYEMANKTPPDWLQPTRKPY